MMRRKTKTIRTATAPATKTDQKQPFIEHVYEFKQRLFYVVLSMLLFGGVGYGIQQKLVHFLLAPAKAQQFIYTSPGGGLNFLFQICFYFGVIASIPVIIYNLLRFMEPLINARTRKLIIGYSFVAGILAALGIAFGYVVGLPVALTFLTHQFTTQQIHPLLTIQEYMSFITIYLLGSAMLFQIPLIMLFVNRIKPLRPSKLLSFERYLVLLAFIAAAVLTPTPDIFNQLLFAGPIIAVYQVGIVIIFFVNRRRQPAKHFEPIAKQLPAVTPFVAPPAPLKTPSTAKFFDFAPAAPAKQRPSGQILPSRTAGYMPRPTPQPQPRVRAQAKTWDVVDPLQQPWPTS